MRENQNPDEEEEEEQADPGQGSRKMMDWCSGAHTALWKRVSNYLLVPFGIGILTILAANEINWTMINIVGLHLALPVARWSAIVLLRVSCCQVKHSIISAPSIGRILWGESQTDCLSGERSFQNIHSV